MKGLVNNNGLVIPVKRLGSFGNDGHSEESVAMLVEERYNWTCVQAGKLNTEKIYGCMLKLTSKP